ncbi:MAG: pilus assembly protein [Coriobacteriaceae bacterium]|jgi:hypothetical protein|nr:pilus assembly protein [Coriobacteriaceae bacterium]
MVRGERGQATVEAAFLTPLVFVLLLLLIQPGILLYNHMVMQAAASEGCRLLATRTDAAGAADDKYRSYILRRLGAVPPQDNFHVHNAGGCSWEIELVGNEGSLEVAVTIRNKARPLPLFDGAGRLLGILGDSGTFEQEVTVRMSTQPPWAASSPEGLNPRAWVEKNLGQEDE